MLAWRSTRLHRALLTRVSFQSVTLSNSLANNNVTVTCTAGSQTCSLVFHVADTQPPAMQCFGPAASTSECGCNKLPFSATAFDMCDCANQPVVTCTPASPFTFPLGTTTVICSGMLVLTRWRMFAPLA